MRFFVFTHTIHKTVILCWLPSHMGISGNERADSAAKAALQKYVSNCLISYTDTYQYISQYVRDMWQREWDTAVNNKLHLLIGEQLSAYRSVRRDEVVLSRLKLGHSYLTHSYLLNGEPPPECVTCNCRLTISHILLDCIEYDFFQIDFVLHSQTYLIMCLQTKSHLSKELDCTTLCNSLIVLFKYICYFNMLVV